MYFKAFQLPLRKKVTDTEIGKKPQVILKEAVSSTVNINPHLQKRHKEMAVFLSTGIVDDWSQTVLVIMIKSTCVSTIH